MKKAQNTLTTDVAALQGMVLKLREQNQALNKHPCRQALFLRAMQRPA